MKQIAFIINPISGAKRLQEVKHRLPELVAQILDHEQWEPTLVYTTHTGHATELARHYAQAGFAAVVSVGGDGTMNEVAQGLRDTPTAMAILPMGSGNGLARHLHIPMNTRKAIALLNNCKMIDIDYGLANERLFVCTCGAGLDAEVANRFACSAQRGFMTYMRHILHLVFTYKAQTYHLTGDGICETHRAVLITFANANQWGNAARIAPNADIQDGKMDIILMSPYALWGSLPLAIRLFWGTIDRSPLIKTIRAGEITLQRECIAPFHIDGDPVQTDKDIRIRIVRRGLRVLVADGCQ